jgi:hypothetical protein
MHDMYATQIIASQALSIVYNSTRLAAQASQMNWPHIASIYIHIFVRPPP